MKRLSVLMPAWNAGGTIATSVESALADDPRIEVVVVDDASTDDTRVVVAMLQERHPRRIVLETLQRNGGPSVARSRALELASGDWVGLLDADDLWLPGRLARLEPRMEESDVVSDSLLVREDGHADRIIPAAIPAEEIRSLDLALLVRLDLGYLQPLVRRSFLQDNGIGWGTHRHSEDFLLAWRILRAGARWSHVQSPGYVYIRTATSLTGQRRKGLEQGVSVLASLLDDLPEDPLVKQELHRRIRIKSDLLALEDLREHPGPRNLARAVPSFLRLARIRILGDRA